MDIHSALQRLIAYQKPYIGARELAEILGEKRTSVRKWKQRKLLPEPITQLAMGPIWTTPQIKQWLAHQYLQAGIAKGDEYREPNRIALAIHNALFAPQAGSD